MSHNRDSSPVYYREIQKNAYLKRIPDEVTSSKSLGLRPLGIKKAPLKPLWTQLCVHNGRTPYLEQYRDPTAARAHRPAWRASLLTARHVTASVTARDNEYDFLVDTHEGPVRMLAPDWESMQDWVSCLRSRLHELKILPLCENVYCAAPAAAAPRAAARDPTSPLPPAPLPPDRIPGIDLTPLIRNAVHATEPPAEDPESPSSLIISTSSNTLPSASNTLPSASNTLPSASNTLPSASNALPSASNPSTLASNTYTSISNTSTAAINASTSAPYSKSASNPTAASYISAALYIPTAVSNASSPNASTSATYASTSAPNVSTTETIDISSWEASETSEPFQSLPSTSQVPKSVTKICGQNICLDDSIFKRTCESDDDDFLSDRSSLGSKSGSLGSKTGSSGSKRGSVGCKANVTESESSLKDSAGSEVNNYKQRLVVSEQADPAKNGTSDHSTNITVIQVSNKEPPHTAIPVIGPETDVFDFDFKSAPRNPNFVNIVNTEVNVQNSNEYGTVFSKNEPEYGHLSLTTTVSLTGDVKLTDVRNDSESLYEKLCLASTSNEFKASPLSIRRLKSQEKVRKSSLPNLDSISSDSTYEYLFLSQNNNNLSDTGSNMPSNVMTTQSNVSPNIASTQRNIAPTHSIRSNVTAALNISTTSANVTTISTTTNTSNVFNSETLHDLNSRVHVNSVSIGDSNTRALRSNIERSNSQNTYDVSPRREVRIEQNGAKRNGKVEKIESVQPKPIWKRGLTELSLLTRLRGITHGKRHESPDRHDRNAVTSPVKVVHRSRPEARIDRNRRRSSSLSNGQSPPSSAPPALQTLRARQAATLRSEQRRGAALVAAVRCADPPVFADYNKQVWIAWWGGSGARVAGRAGDRVCGVRGAVPRDAAHARALLAAPRAHAADILFHRVPLGKIYVINKRDQESTGIKLDSECNITSVEGDSPAAGAGIPPPGKWAVTEVNNQPINLAKVGNEEMNRLSLRGTEASVLIQPSALVKKLRAALKGNRTLLGLR